MDSGGRDTTWRQGDVVSAADLCQLVGEIQRPDQAIGVVISHDCDLTNTAEKEPHVELIIARPIERLGQNAHAKNARLLHLQYLKDNLPRCFELSATEKFTVSKAEILALIPAQEFKLSNPDRYTLRRWLAARYDRQAFPENFARRLKQRVSGRKTLADAIATVLDEAGVHIRALYFDLDKGEELERGPADPYRLGIVVLHIGNGEDEAAYVAAERVATAIEKIFDQISDVTLEYCNPVSDSVLTIAQATSLKEWRMEHLSLRADPMGPTTASL